MKKLLFFIFLLLCSSAQAQTFIPDQRPHSGQVCYTNKANTFTKSQTINGTCTATSFSGAGTGLTGTAASLTAGTVTINANLTGVITSSGNATSTGAQTGTGNTFVMSVSPTITGTETVANVTGAGNQYLSGGYIETGAAYTANTGTSYAINIDNGPKQVITITGAVAITLAAPTHAGSATIKLLEDGTGHVYSITGCKWPGGTAITYSTAAGTYDIVSIWYDGTNSNCTGGAGFN